MNTNRSCCNNLHDPKAPYKDLSCVYAPPMSPCGRRHEPFFLCPDLRCLSMSLQYSPLTITPPHSPCVPCRAPCGRGTEDDSFPIQPMAPWKGSFSPCGAPRNPLAPSNDSVLNAQTQPRKKEWNWKDFIVPICIVLAILLVIYVGIIIYYAAQPAEDTMKDSTFVKKDHRHETENYRTSLFSGRVTHDRMLSICDQLDKEGGQGCKDFDGVKYLGNIEKNASAADLFKVFSDDSGLLPSEKWFVWTGCIWRWVQNRGSWELKCSNRDLYDPGAYCDKNGVNDLEQLQNNTDHNEVIFIVKYYGHLLTACMKSMNLMQLTQSMGQPSGSIPELPFMCNSPHNLKTIMKDNNAMNKYLRTKVRSGKFSIYGAPATIEDAIRECHSQGYKLVTIDTPAKLVQVEDALRKDGSSYTDDDKFWTGGYFNVSSGVADRAYLKWLGTPNTTTIYSDELFPNFSMSELDKAYKNLENSIKRCEDQGRNCAERSILYVGLHFPNGMEESSRGLTVLNSYGDFSNRDTYYFYVICET